MISRPELYKVIQYLHPQFDEIITKSIYLYALNEYGGYQINGKKYGFHCTESHIGWIYENFNSEGRKHGICFIHSKRINMLPIYGDITCWYDGNKTMIINDISAVAYGGGRAIVSLYDPDKMLDDIPLFIFRQKQKILEEKQEIIDFLN